MNKLNLQVLLELSRLFRLALHVVSVVIEPLFKAVYPVLFRSHHGAGVTLLARKEQDLNI